MQASQQQLPQLIQEESWKQLKKHYQQKFKKPLQTSIFVVLASLALVNQHTNTFEIVSIGFGTKSLPDSVVTQQNRLDLLRDMHAQMLVFQQFKRFVLRQLQNPTQSYFQWNQKKKKLSLCSHFKVILYCSQLFCGDCCINQDQSSFSGAKPLRYLKDASYPDSKFQPNVLRTKPGRLDLPIQKRSSILSCSDLIALTNILGIQGKTLFSKITPVYLSTIVLEGNTKHIENVRKGIDFQGRLKILRKKTIQLIDRQIFNIVVDGKERKISSQFRMNRPLVVILEKNTDRNRQGFELCGVIGSQGIQWINGKTGLPQGSSLSNYKLKGKTSRCCEAKLRLNPLYKQDQNSFKYDAIHDRLKHLFGEWIDQ